MEIHQIDAGFVYVYSIRISALHPLGKQLLFPVQEIQRFGDQNRRNDAVDTAEFYRENQVVDNCELKDLEQDLDYTPTEKLKRLVWNGTIMGELHDAHSGLRAISTDLSVAEGLRETGIQSWKNLAGRKDF
jgi:hypothetical protein